MIESVTGMPVEACVGRGTGVIIGESEIKVQTLRKYAEQDISVWIKWLYWRSVGGIRCYYEQVLVSM